MFWWPFPIFQFLTCARLGYPLVDWFYPVHPLPRRVLVAAHYLTMLGRLAGVPFPLPERCDVQTPERLVGRGWPSSSAWASHWFSGP